MKKNIAKFLLTLMMAVLFIAPTAVYASELSEDSGEEIIVGDDMEYDPVLEAPVNETEQIDDVISTEESSAYTLQDSSVALSHATTAEQPGNTGKLVAIAVFGAAALILISIFIKRTIKH